MSEAPPPTPVEETPSAASVTTRPSKKTKPSLDSSTAAVLAQILPQLAPWPFLSSLVSSCVHQATPLPTSINPKLDAAPWLHWSKTDRSLKSTDGLTATNATLLQGYRMARANKGVSQGRYYWEAVIQEGPTADQVKAALPAQARLGPGLEAQLNSGNTENQIGHVRLGFSMRTGDLQAPVGYDKWSYGIRDIGGSLIHQSQRQDSWGGEDFGPGDVVGCGIVFEEDESHIRFFKNGVGMGQFVLRKGKRTGGEAFFIEPGTYYPAVSTYLGGSIRANFGPYFICPPRKLPLGLKGFDPFSDLCARPQSPDMAVATLGAAVKQLKSEDEAVLLDGLRAESELLCQSYSDFMQEHIDFVRKEREERDLPTTDLPEKVHLQENSSS